MFSTERKLRDARRYLKEIGKFIDRLESYLPDIFNDTSLKPLVDSFRQEHKEALRRLDAPALSIATLGTTSSGKSTIVNALLGHRIAPMEAGEMSGGVLKFQHSLDEHQVFITKTEGAIWETGSFQGNGDDKVLYDRISEVMLTYHTERITKEGSNCAAPQVKVHCPLLPAANRALLGLPEGVGVELIDLPGLKSIQDGANLAVIQDQIPRCFNIVALD